MFQKASIGDRDSQVLLPQSRTKEDAVPAGPLLLLKLLNPIGLFILENYMNFLNNKSRVAQAIPSTVVGMEDAMVVLPNWLSIVLSKKVVSLLNGLTHTIHSKELTLNANLTKNSLLLSLNLPDTHKSLQTITKLY